MKNIVRRAFLTSGYKNISDFKNVDMYSKNIGECCPYFSPIITKKYGHVFFGGFFGLIIKEFEISIKNIIDKNDLELQMLDIALFSAPINCFEDESLNLHVQKNEINDNIVNEWVSKISKILDKFPNNNSKLFDEMQYGTICAVNLDIFLNLPIDIRRKKYRLFLNWLQKKGYNIDKLLNNFNNTNYQCNNINNMERSITEHTIYANTSNLKIIH